MKVTAISSLLEGSGGWRTTDLPFPWIAGFNNQEPVSCYWLNPGAVFIAALVPREQFYDNAPQKTKQIIQHCNVAYPDIYHHSVFIQELRNRFQGKPPGVDLHQAAYQMYETAEAYPTPIATDLQINVLQSLQQLMDRLISGEDITVAQAAKEQALSMSGYKKIVLDITGMTPKAFINLAKTEGVLAMLRDPLLRRTNAVEDSLVSIANFYNWSEASARNNVKALTTELPNALLIKR